MRADADTCSTRGAQVVYTAAHRPPNIPAALAPFFTAMAAPPAGDADADSDAEADATPAPSALPAAPPAGKLLLSREVDVRAAVVRGQSVAVVGGGMTAAALALAALRLGAAQARTRCARCRGRTRADANLWLNANAGYVDSPRRDAQARA
jgi:hypothetical protein